MVSEARQPILALFDHGATLDFVEIASELGLGIELVVSICRELVDEGKLEIFDDSPSGEGYVPGAFTCHGSLRRKYGDCS